MLNEIIIGQRDAPMWRLTNEVGHVELRTITGVLSAALVGDQLPWDEVRPQIYTEAYMEIHSGFIPQLSNGLITSSGKRFSVRRRGTGFRPPIPYGTPIYWYADGVLMGKFYAKELRRKTQTDFALTAVSAIGILDQQQHSGGLYTGETFDVVAADILGDSFPLACVDSLKAQRVYGWLPIASRRANLHQLLFSLGALVVKDADGEIFFAYPDDTLASVPDERLYYEGDVTDEQAATSVDLTEHTYYPLDSDAEETLFDNTNSTTGAAVHERITFSNAPVHDLQTTGTLTVEESNCNYAVVSGYGTLTGKLYTHITRTVTSSRIAPNQLPNVVPVSNITLVSVANSQNVADRLLSYYGSARTIAASMVVDTEKPGQRIRFRNPFMETEDAYIANMELNASGNIKASCQLIADYAPETGGNNFNSTEMLTGSGVFTVPPDVTLLRVVLQGGGQGGYGGFTAPDLPHPPVTEQRDSTITPPYVELVYHYRDCTGGEPGQANRGGDGGKILVLTIPVVPGQQFSYSCGLGGAGGAPDVLEPQPGAAGGATTFGEFSSEIGISQSVGYYDPFTGEVTGTPGLSGIAGAPGAGFVRRANEDEYDRNYPTLEVNGQIFTSGAHGSPGTADDFAGSYDGANGYYSARANAGFGGGPAYGASGGDTGPVTGTNVYATTSSARVSPGRGGQGANALSWPDATGYGNGGRGGNGGGGAGACFYNRVRRGGRNIELSVTNLRFGHPAPSIGGQGSYGSRGSDGCIRVYY